MSFGFSVLEDTWDEDDQGQMIRTLLKVKLYEVSPVTFPAYTETEVGVRALLGDEVTPPARAEELPVEEDEPNHDESDQRALVEIDAHDAALRAQAAERRAECN